MKIEHFILAQNSSIDREDNSLSIFNILEDITVRTSAGKPVTLPVQAVIVAKRESDDDEKIQPSFFLKVFNSNDQEVLRQQLGLNMDASHNRSRLRVNFHIPLESSGTYRVDLDPGDGSELLGQFTFEVSLKQEAEPEEPPQTVQ